MRKVLLLLAYVFAIQVMAEKVSPQQALQAAQSFLSQQTATGRRAASANAQLTMTEQVNGLYVFNVSGDNGFVIVSNDDRTDAVLGYADQGHFDADNMPDNMRAWLQEYANQIAWMQAHDVPVLNVQASRRAATPVKEEIPQLLSTYWDQTEPYNNKCPEYQSGYTSATGCVATAMAQVMYYHKYPQTTTQQIPSYTWASKGTTLGPLGITTFDWNNMKTSYSGSETSTQKTAIAKLMQYCGYSVEMNYGASSGASSSDVAPALINYFGYNSGTTQLVVRSLYAYSDWIDIIYHELANDRPVFYSGSSDGGGHAFVVDGYAGEDYFHVNWGWSGTSNGYFKLSALDPAVQGTGGSSSTDGYHYGQDAVIGIQKSSESGTVHSKVTTALNTPSLSLQSITLSKSSINVGETVNVTFNVTNTGSKVYDGEILVGYKSSKGTTLASGKMFVIQPGETKACTVPFTPTTFYGTVSIYGFYPNSKGTYYWLSSSIYKQLTVTNPSSSSSLTLSMAVNSVENGEYVSVSGSTKRYNVYGNHLKLVLRVTNSNSTKYRGQFGHGFIPEGSSGSVYSSTIEVPANGYLDIPISTDEVEYNKSYYLYTRYQNGSYWTSYTQPGYFTINRPLAVYYTDGSVTLLKPTSSYAVADNVVAVDVTNTIVTSITPNSKPNTLYIYGTSKPSGLDGKNTVQYSGGAYTAQSIQLTDGQPFYSPVTFTAGKVTFTYNHTQAGYGKSGWNTIMLPFNVTQVTVGDKVVDWYHSSTEVSKDFLLKEFTSNDESNVNFTCVSGDMLASTPYLVAFPGSQWGSRDVTGKTIRFIGDNTTVYQTDGISSVTGTNYYYTGGTLQSTTSTPYTMNAAGTQFVKGTSAIAPFRAYFAALGYTGTTTLTIGSDDGEITGIREVSSDRQQSAVCYDLQGRRIDKPAKGLYIMNGKKYVAK